MNNKRHLIESVTQEDKHIQAICLSETWITAAKLDLLQLEEYQVTSKFNRSIHGGGGVCVFLKNNIPFIERKDISDLSIEFVFEVCATEILHLNMLIVVIYWPNSQRNPNIFYEKLENLLQIIVTKDVTKNVVIGGDFNVNVLEKSALSISLINLLISYNFQQLVNEPTRITDTSSTCIDLLFTNFHNKNNVVSVYEYGFSDHKGVIYTIPNNTNNQDRKVWFTNKRKFTENNISAFKSYLSKINWSTIIDSNNNINENFYSFTATIQKNLDTCIPKTQVKIKKQLNKKSWLTTGIKTSCKHKRLLKILITKTNNPILHEHYKHYEKLLKNTVKKSKKLDYINKIKNSNNITKTMWHMIKKRTNKLPKKNRINIKLNINNSITDDPSIIANYFNNFFVSVGAGDGPCVRNAAGRPVLNPTPNSFYLQPVTEIEIRHIIRNLKNKSSFGHDELPPVLIKKCADELSAPLAFLINQSFFEGIVPDSLKLSIIKPIHKKGKQTDCNNYRPIALLPTFSKIIETAMSKRLYTFCEKYSIFNENQNGFRKNHSTTLAVYNYINKILNIINNKQYAIGVLLDMSKAYDRVSYDVLLKKLYGIGVRGFVHKWFDSYLKNRVQFVEIEHHNNHTGIISRIHSNRVNVTQSIPQGSVLGCLLFLIYINDLPYSINTPSILFADDISVVFPCINNNNLNSSLTHILTEIDSWLTKHNLQLNFSKTKLMQFRPHQRQPLNIDFSYNNIKLEQTDTFPLLGLTIDTNINWKDHIQKVSNKLSRFSYALLELKKTTDLKTATSAYYAYAHSILRYGILLWGNSTNANNLFILQKKCIRILANIKPRESCRPHFKNLKILTLTSLYIFEVCTFVKLHSSFFLQAKDRHAKPLNLRQNNFLSLPTSTLKIFHSGPHMMCIKIFNKLPQSIKEIENSKLFNKALNTHLKDKSFYTLQEFFDNGTLN